MSLLMTGWQDTYVPYNHLYIDHHYLYDYLLSQVEVGMGQQSTGLFKAKFNPSHVYLTPKPTKLHTFSSVFDCLGQNHSVIPATVLVPHDKR